MPLLPPAPGRFSWIHRLRPALLLLACVVLAATVRGEAEANLVPKIAPAPDWVQPGEWKAPAQVQANSTGEDFLLVDEQWRLATQENYHHNVSQIVTDHGRQDASQVYFYFDPSYQSLTIHQLKVVRGTESFDRLDATKIQVLQQERDLDRQMYNGQRSALVILDDVRVGDIIDIAFTVKGRNPVFGDKFIDTASVGWSTPVRRQQYRLLLPAGREVPAKVIGSAPDLAMSRTTRGTEEEWTWSRVDMPILETEEHAPSTEYLYPFLDFSEYRTWDEVVDWAVPLYTDDHAPAPLLEALVAKIRAGAASPEQQALDALTYVQQEIRYLGIEMGAGSHRPSAPEEVLRRRFGDCKDKARLLATVLQRLGLSASPVLVNTFRREAVRDRLPTPYVFDHAIVALDFGATRYLLDPTISYQRGDGLALRHIGRYKFYLRVAPGNHAGLEETNLGADDVIRSDIKQEINCPAFDRPATMTVTTVAQGRAAENLRAYFATHTGDQIDRTYLDYYTRYYPTISRTQPVEYIDSPRSNSARIIEHYKIDQLFTRANATAPWRAEFQPASIWEYVRVPNLTQRRLPYAISHPVELREQFIVQLPTDWNIKAEQERVDDPAFSLSNEVKLLNPRTMSVDYGWKSRAFQVAPARLKEFSTKIEAARANLGYVLTWRPSVAAATATTTMAVNWPMVGLAVGIGLAGAYASWRVLQRRNPTPPEPPLLSEIQAPADPYSYRGRMGERQNLEGVGGWLILVAIGLFFRPIAWIYALYAGRAAYFNQRVWKVLTDPDSARFNTNFALIAPLEMICIVLLLVYSLLLLALFFRRSYLFPRTIQVYLGSLFAYSLFNLWDVTMMGHKLSFEHYRLVFVAALTAAIWIPYFHVSRRVKATFTR